MVLIGVGGLVVFGLANSVFSGVKQVADNSSGVLADGPNASLAQSYTAPDGSFRVTFPGLPEELPSGVSLWNNETHLTHQVVASIGQPLFSRVRYADLSDAEAATDLATFYKSLCRSLGSHPSDSDDLVSGQPAMRCQVDNGTTFDDHELLRHDNRIYDISSTYGPDDIGAADVHDAFVQSFELT